MPPTPMQHVPAWRVISQTTTTKADEAGRFVPGWDITFETINGHRGVVFIPDTRYGNVEGVRATIAAKAALVDSVGALQG